MKAAYVPPSVQNPPMFVGGGVELFDIVLRMDGLGAFAEEWGNCVVLTLGRQRLKVLRVDRILASKRAANRTKDRLVIPVLEDSLTTSQVTTRGKRKTPAARERKPSS